MASQLPNNPNTPVIKKIAYDSCKATPQQTTEQQVIEYTLNYRKNDPKKGRHFTVNCSAAFLLDKSGKIDIQTAAFSDSQRAHAEILVLVDILKQKDAKQKSNETEHKFIENNLHLLKDFRVVLFTERAPCEITTYVGQEACDTFFKKINKNLNISIYYSVPKAVSSQQMRSPDNESVTLGMLLPQALYTLEGFEGPPDIQDFVKAQVKYDAYSSQSGAPAELIYYLESPIDYAKRVRLSGCEILLATGSMEIQSDMLVTNRNNYNMDIRDKTIIPIKLKQFEKKIQAQREKLKILNSQNIPISGSDLKSIRGAQLKLDHMEKSLDEFRMLLIGSQSSQLENLKKDMQNLRDGLAKIQVSQWEKLELEIKEQALKHDKITFPMAKALDSYKDIRTTQELLRNRFFELEGSTDKNYKNYDNLKIQLNKTLWTQRLIDMQQIILTGKLNNNISKIKEDLENLKKSKEKMDSKQKAQMDLIEQKLLEYSNKGKIRLREEADEEKEQNKSQKLDNNNNNATSGKPLTPLKDAIEKKEQSPKITPTQTEAPTQIQESNIDNSNDKLQNQ